MTHHRYFTEREHRWREFIGAEYDRLWELAQRPWDKDYSGPLRSLKEASDTLS